MRAAKIRSGFEQTSTDMGVANIGDIIDEIESRVNARGITRVRYDRGWLSVKAADGGTSYSRILHLCLCLRAGRRRCLGARAGRTM